jgi:muramoyltetrapeptide carboxypeptidase LdcA involved in peptidoglycan recycling
MILYPALGPGARVALVAPAGPISIPKDLERAQHNAKTLGWDVVLGENVREKEGYFAGSD